MNAKRRQRLRRAAPVIALALVAFAIGAIVGVPRGGSPALGLARGFVAAWSRHDYKAMYTDLDAASRRRISAASFARTYEADLMTATAGRLRIVGRPSRSGTIVSVPVRVTTRLWGQLRLSFEVPTVETSSEGLRIAWSPAQGFPGLHHGETLHRHTYLPPRASLLDRNGGVLAETTPGEQITEEGHRTSPLGEIGAAVIGTVGPVPSARRAALEAEGVPGEAIVGLSGLELALDARLRGRPGGQLMAGARVLASVRARPAPPARTSVSAGLQKEAVTALGGQLGGVVVMQPATGEVLAVAGLGLDGLQPPGSTFKIITLSGVLKAHLASARTVFPYATHAVLDGVTLSNANGEECGGSLELAFAVSCNSVFTPLGVKLGAERLVAMAEAYGFNHPPGITGASESTLPPASQIQGELAVGSTAIGQGEVLATPLEMAVAAATIADGGRRPTPSFVAGPAQTGPEVLDPAEARAVRHMMTEVVLEGTGVSAAIPGVTVAGKTGTAELQSDCTQAGSETGAATETGETEENEENEEKHGCTPEQEAANTDAWFTSFAPALDPKLVVTVMLVKDGAGGDTAAPVAREILEAGLAG